MIMTKLVWRNSKEEHTVYINQDPLHKKDNCSKSLWPPERTESAFLSPLSWKKGKIQGGPSSETKTKSKRKAETMQDPARTVTENTCLSSHLLFLYHILPNLFLLIANKNLNFKRHMLLALIYVTSKH